MTCLTPEARSDQRSVAAAPIEGRSITVWCIRVESHRRQSWGDVKADFGSASLVGNCVVFNIGGNKYRLATRILYPSQKVFILKCMAHTEYDEDKWKTDCGCYEPPPFRLGKAAKAATEQAKPAKRGT